MFTMGRKNNLWHLHLNAGWWLIILIFSLQNIEDVADSVAENRFQPIRRHLRASRMHQLSQVYTEGGRKV